MKQQWLMQELEKFCKKKPILSFGNPGDLTYEYKIVGNRTEDIKKFINKQNKASEDIFKI